MFGYGAPFAALPVLMACAAFAAVYLLFIRPRGLTSGENEAVML